MSRRSLPALEPGGFPENNIKRIRYTANKTITELAKATGISGSSLSRVERRNLPLYPGWRTRIARALNVAPEEL